MISNFSDIFHQNMFSKINENTGDFILKITKKYDDSINPISPTRKFFNKNNILDLIRRHKYDRAIKLIKSNKINPFSIFNDVTIFGNRYDNIPFVAAAIALALEKSKNTESMYDKFNNIISNLFIPSGINSSNMFDAKFISPSGCNDVLSFVLTHDGQIKPKKYSEESDFEILVLLNSLLSGGYTLQNSCGIVKYLIDNDLISSLKKLVEYDIYKLNIDDLKKYSVSPQSNIGKYIAFSAPHPFKLHSPDIEFDDKGKFSGGALFNPLKSVGYDISKPDKEFKVHLSVPFMIKDYIENAKNSYIDNGESFTNDSDINFGEGSEFLDAVNTLKYLSSEYNKYLRSPELKRMTDDDRKKYMVDMVKTANSNIFRLQNSLNGILHNIGFPNIILTLNNALEDDDGKILYKTSPFMKEIWNSVKLCK